MGVLARDSGCPAAPCARLKWSSTHSMNPSATFGVMTNTELLDNERVRARCRCAEWRIRLEPGPSDHDEPIALQPGMRTQPASRRARYADRELRCTATPREKKLRRQCLRQARGSGYEAAHSTYRPRDVLGRHRDAPGCRSTTGDAGGHPSPHPQREKAKTDTDDRHGGQRPWERRATLCRQAAPFIDWPHQRAAAARVS
jgi:hypothetical protein